MFTWLLDVPFASVMKNMAYQRLNGFLLISTCFKATETEIR